MTEDRQKIDRLKEVFGVKTDEELAEKLDVTLFAVRSWKQRNSLPKKYELILLEKEASVFIEHLGESSPDREYKSIEDIKRRLGIKGNEALARFLRVSVSEVIRLRDSKEKIPQDMQDSARVVEYLLKDMAASCDGMKDDENWAILNYESARNVIIDDDMLRLIDLIVHHGSKEAINQTIEKFQALKKALDGF